MFTVTRLQAATYLIGVCFFSISFLVFLNSSISFVVTDLIRKKKGVGDAVGTLGFADESIALIACPLWGVLSDRIGVRTVCALGYTVIGLALLLIVQARNVYPELLLARIFFSVGGSATSTMVTAILPLMTKASDFTDVDRVSPLLSSAPINTTNPPDPQTGRAGSSSSKSLAKSSTTLMAGLVGLFTGCGALLAVALFLPLPAIFQNLGVEPKDALTRSYYVIGFMSLAVSALCFFGLRDLQGENRKGWPNFTQPKKNDDANPSLESTLRFLPLKLLFQSIKLGYIYPDLGLAYLGGFVARASSVGISLFIPLYVNYYFIKSGTCNTSSHDVPFLKEHCREAYILAAKLTGVSQLVALIFAPVFGYLAANYQRFNVPLLAAALLGILGYLALAFQNSPQLSGKDGNPWIYPIVAMLGISQIGSIVCSLGLVGRFVLDPDPDFTGLLECRSPTDGSPVVEFVPSGEDRATSSDALLARRPLMDDNDNDNDETQDTSQRETVKHTTYIHLKGSIAGIYSLSGGAGILLLTKVGGATFDQVSPVTPFYLLSFFNFLLFFYILYVLSRSKYLKN